MNKYILGLSVLLFSTLSFGAQLETATFAGGCFWCMEPPFEKLDGVKEAVSGFSGGPEKNPSYKDVAGGKTGHTEVVQIKFDPKKVSYEKLLDVFWRNIDPTTPNRQFVDVGSQYRPEIFFHNEEQKQQAAKSKVALTKSKIFKKPIIVPITAASKFYQAEDYHQDYYKTNPVRYKFYRYRSGRDQFLEKTWGKKKSTLANNKKK